MLWLQLAYQFVVTDWQNLATVMLVTAGLGGFVLFFLFLPSISPLAVAAFKDMLVLFPGPPLSFVPFLHSPQTSTPFFPVSYPPHIMVGIWGNRCMYWTHQTEEKKNNTAGASSGIPSTQSIHLFNLYQGPISLSLPICISTFIFLFLNFISPSVYSSLYLTYHIT